MLKSGTAHWGALAKFFHWTIVLLILVQGTVGLIMVNLPKRPNVIPVYNFHKSVGLTILLLAVLRLLWRAFDRRPLEPPDMPAWQALGARSGHALLYLLIFAVPLSGWWFDSVSALRPLQWFGLVQMPSLSGGPDPALKDVARATHYWLFWLLMLVAAGHATMAFIHQFVHRNNVLGRMWPASLQPKPKPASLSESAHVTPPDPPARVVAAAVAPDAFERDGT